MAMEETPSGQTASPAALISTQLVQLVAKYAGRGPTMARTSIGRDHVLVLLRDTLTRHERTLSDHGDQDVVLAGRQGLQDAFKDEAVALVEEIVGRKVIAFISSNHLDPDIASELFVLEPDGDGDLRREPLEEGEAEG